MHIFYAPSKTGNDMYAELLKEKEKNVKTKSCDDTGKMLGDMYIKPDKGTCLKIPIFLSCYHATEVQFANVVFLTFHFSRAIPSQKLYIPSVIMQSRNHLIQLPNNPTADPVNLSLLPSITVWFILQP